MKNLKIYGHFFLFLIIFNQLALANHDDRLRDLSKKHPEFSGLYYDSDDSINVAIKAQYASRSSGQDVFGLDSSILEDTLGVSLIDSLEQVYGEGVLRDSVLVNNIDGLGESVEKIEPRLKNVLYVSYSFAELYGALRSVEEKISENKGVVSYDIDERGNILAFEAVDKESMNQLNHTLSGMLERSMYKISIAKRPTFQNLRARYTPFKGGSQIYYQLGTSLNICTAGFEGRINNVRGIFSNSHCTIIQGAAGDGTGMRQGNTGSNTWIGDSTLESAAVNANCPAWMTCYNTDAAFFPMPAGLGSATKILKAKGLNTESIDLKTTGKKEWTRLYNWGGNGVVGQKVYKTGRTTGTTSGFITNVCVNVNTAWNTRINCTNRVASVGARWSAGGDSGSAVVGPLSGGTDYWDYTYNSSNAAQILGLHFAGDGTNGWYIPFTAIEDELGNITNFK